MDELHDALDKLFTEVDHLERVVGDDEVTADEVRLALVVAKRVRRTSNIAVRVLAQLRDEMATAPEGTSA